MIIIRTLRKDIARYNADEGPDEAIEETGWKLVHGDVFRPPKYPRLFAAVVGTGVQIFVMCFITLCEKINVYPVVVNVAIGKFQSLIINFVF